MWALVPAKSPIRAKTRLASFLGASERAVLARAMLLDVLEVLGATPELEGIAVVTRDRGVRRLIEERGHVVVDEGPASQDAPDAGLNAALDRGREWLLSRGTDRALILPGDVPLVGSAELDRLIAALERPIEGETAGRVALVSDREGDGTNALALRPLSAFTFRFGPGSAQLHRQEARTRSLDLVEVNAPGIALDVDTLEDLEELTRRAAETEAAPRTRSVLSRLAGVDRALAPLARDRALREVAR